VDIVEHIQGVFMSALEKAKARPRDLVDQLRDNQGQGHAGGCQGCFHNVMDDAADEIERLRKALSDVLRLIERTAGENDRRESMTEHTNFIDHLFAGGPTERQAATEIIRLRTLLEVITKLRNATEIRNLIRATLGADENKTP
jgi:hypothetical protein